MIFCCAFGRFSFLSYKKLLYKNVFLNFCLLSVSCFLYKKKTFFSDKKHVHKKHEAELIQKLRNIYETWTGCVSNVVLKDCSHKTVFDQTRKKIETASIICLTKPDHPFPYIIVA